MLPTIILQPSDFANFESELSSPNLLPEDATQPEIGFADLLALGTAIPYEEAAVAGDLLPAGGKTLPLANVDTLPETELAELQDSVARRPEALPIPMPVATAITARAGGNPAAMSPLATAARPGIPGAVVGQELRPDQAPALPAVAQRVAGPLAGAVADSLEVSNPRFALERSPAELPPAVTRSIPENITATVKQESQPVIPGAAATQLEDARRMTRAPLPVGISGDRSTQLRDSSVRPSVELPQAETPRDVRPAITAVQPAAAPSATGAPAPAAELPQPGVTPTATVASGTPQPQGSGEPAATGPRVGERIDLPVRDPAWGEQLGQRLQMMASNRLQTAEIRLTPAELGPLRVQVAIDDGAANVTFQAQHAVTREAIEQALPRLREMLGENGLTLNQADIGEQGAQQGNREATDKRGGAAEATAAKGTEPELDDGDDRGRRLPDPNTLVDTFA